MSNKPFINNFFSRGLTLYTIIPVLKTKQKHCLNQSLRTC